LNNGKRKTVLEIDYGRGADTHKHFAGHAIKVVATDRDNEARKQALDRYRETIGNKMPVAGKNKTKGYNLFYYPLKIINPDYVQKIKISHPHKFDLICWHLAIHFSFHPDLLSIIGKHLNQLAAYNGYVIITTTHGENILKLLGDKIGNSVKLQNVLFKRENEEIISSYIENTTTEPMQEYIVHPLKLIGFMSDYSFRLIEMSTFANLMDSYVKYGGHSFNFHQSSASLIAFIKETYQIPDYSELYELLKLYVIYVFKKI
jgi:hypothetical protein